MPKVKTKKIVRKRFKVTKTGKVMHRRQGSRHLRSRKSASRKRRQDEPQRLKSTKFSRVVKQYIQT